MHMRYDNDENSFRQLQQNKQNVIAYFLALV